ncbi:MAG: ComF family protein [Enterococcus sp.]
MNCCYCKKTITRNLTFRELLRSGKYLNTQCCDTCHQLFHLLEYPKCQGCQKQLEVEQEAIRFCANCLEWKTLYPDYAFEHQAIYQYDYSFQEWLHRYKFLGDIFLAGTFTEELTQLRERFPGFIYCPLPISKQRYEERGFNQVIELLKAAHLRHHLLLKRTLHLSPQAQKTRTERMESPQPFELAVPKEAIRDKNILLIDDVYTTGRTLFHAAQCINQYAPKRICTFSLAR